MAMQRVHQASFLRGELDPKMVSRTDLQAYGAGLKKARNIIPINQGGVERRCGSAYRANLGGQSRLESFVFSQGQEYILAFQNTVLKIYSTNGTLLQTITSCAWATAQLFELDVTQTADTMIVVHSSFSPQIIKRTGATTFTVSAFAFEESTNGEQVYQPYFKFADSSITLDINNTSKGATGVTCTTSADYWTNDYVGQRIRYHGSELLITGFTSATVVTATLKKDVSIELDGDPLKTAQGSGVVEVTMVQHGFATGASIAISGVEDIFDTDGAGLASANLNGTFTITVTDDNHFTYTAGASDTAATSVDGGGVNVKIVGHPPTKRWDEQVIGGVNGYPQTVCFHEQRLYFAGTSALPDGIQGSTVGNFFNFDVGEAEDDQSIQIQIASDQINEIRHLVSGKNLQILTSTGEFYLRPPVSQPVTPTDIRIINQSMFGSQLKAKPRQFDNATIFVQNNSKTVREYLFSESAEEYSSHSISLLSSHLISTPVDSAKLSSVPDRTEQFYFLINTDGTVAVFLSQRNEKIAGWMLWNTDGLYESICATTTDIYTAVQRTINGSPIYALEQFSDHAFDLPTDYTTTKTLSGSYQPHGSPLTDGSFSSTTTFVADGFTNAPSIGEKFQFAGTGTVFTINSVAATGSSGEYTIVIDTASSQSDGVALTFTHSKVFSGLSDYVGKTVYATSGTDEDSAVYYYGSGVVSSGGVVTFDSVTDGADIGLNFDIEVDTFPMDVMATQGQITGMPRKIGKAIIELSSSYNLQVNNRDVVIPNTSIDTSDGLDSFTGKKEVYVLGYSTDPNLEIRQSAPLPVRVLGITTEVYY
tara:strand:- start:3157 stop:5613 length:2457 start_codon:yes stop_codon:yes gene_type:complete